MSNTREIVTFQFGNYSNYIGAHWWNLQEFGFNYDPSVESSEINHDVLYREGKDLKGRSTYTPRLLLVDLEGSFTHLPEGGEIYNDVIVTDDGKLNTIKENALWDADSVEVVQKPSTSKPEFKMDLDNPNVKIDEKEYNLSENVESWTDFLYTRYHPRSLNVIKEYHFSKEKESFDTCTNGARFWNTDQFRDDFSDKIRQYIEECNNCQGFQTIFDCSNGFAGLADKCLEHLNDEYSKANFTIPVFPPNNIFFTNSDGPMTDSIRVANIALTYSKLIENSDIFIPISLQERVYRQLGAARKFSSIDYDEKNLYQSSAILASFLDTITLRYRLKDPSYSNYLSTFCTDVSNYGRKLVAGAVSFPFQMRHNQDLIECLDKFEGNMFTQISPNCKIGTDYIAQSICVRGIPRNRLKKPLRTANEQARMNAYKCDSISEMFQLYFQCQNHASLAHVSAIQNPMKITTPFPQEIFKPTINQYGYLSNFDRQSNEKVLSLPTVASIQSSTSIADTLDTLYREAKRIKIGKLHRFKETGMESDDYSEALETLLEFKINYDDNLQL